MWTVMKPPSGKLEDDQLKDLRFPLICTPKLDGVRGTVQGATLLSATGKLIPNKMMQAVWGCPELENLDGELGDESPCDGGMFNRSLTGTADADATGCIFYVFDMYHETLPYERRIEHAAQKVAMFNASIPKLKLVMVESRIVNNLQEFLALEEEWSGENGAGYEGLMGRCPQGKYKQGRSTHADQWLIRRKKFLDAEAIITGTYEEMMNCNPEKRNEIGKMKRATCKENMKPKGTLGGFYVKVLNGKFKGVSLKIGRFGTEVQAKQMWESREQLVGKILKFKYQLYGSKDKPRIPIALGFREAFDTEMA